MSMPPFSVSWPGPPVGVNLTVADHRRSVLRQLDDLLFRSSVAGDFTDHIGDRSQPAGVLQRLLHPILRGRRRVAVHAAGGAELHADTNRMLAIPMHALTRAVPKALAIRELNIFPRKDQSDNRLVRKVAPSANGRARIRHNFNKAACWCTFARWDQGVESRWPRNGRLTAAVELVNL
jgi:hypothetical protein